MKAIVYRKYGYSDVLKLAEVEKPIPKDNEVLIQVHAASVNSWDWDLLRGKPFVNRLGGLLKPKYNILGADIAGRIEAVGKDVKHLLPGQDVFGDISGCGWGGFAEYTCAEEWALSLKPEWMSFEEAAAIPQAAVLALQGLRDIGKVKKGDHVLINGAGGGVGTFAIQYAKAIGAEVTGVDRTDKLALIRSVGADHVIDYTKDDFTTKGQAYDLILDIVGSRSVSEYKRILRQHGQYVMIGGTMGLIIQVLFQGPIISILEKKRMSVLIHKPNSDDLNIWKELYEAGQVVPIIDRVYSFNEAPQALQRLGEGHMKGKAIISLIQSEDLL